MSFLLGTYAAWEAFALKATGTGSVLLLSNASMKIIPVETYAQVK